MSHIQLKNKNLVTKKPGKQKCFSVILIHDRLVVVHMSQGRLLHKARNIKEQYPRIFDDIIGGKKSKVPSKRL